MSGNCLQKCQGTVFKFVRELSPKTVSGNCLVPGKGDNNVKGVYLSIIFIMNQMLEHYSLNKISFDEI